MENLSLQVASGILIAAIVMTMTRYWFHTVREKDWGMAYALGAFLIIFGGGLILAGLGTIQW